MEIVYLLIPASILLALLALFAFIWAVKQGQFEDLDTPDKKILFDQELNRPKISREDPRDLDSK